MFKNLVLIAIFTLFTVMALISFNIYHNLTTSKISGDSEKKVSPISPHFDQEALDLLQQRKTIEADLSNPVFKVSPTPTTQQTQKATVATPSATIKTTPTPTPTSTTPKPSL